MRIGKSWLLSSGISVSGALLFLFLAAGCRSDVYYQDRAVERAREYLQEHAKELTTEQLYFVKFNRPVLLTGSVLPPGPEPGERLTDLQQICVTWRIPGRDLDYLVYGVSSGSMRNWYPNRLIRKRFEKFILPIQDAMKLARAYSQNYLYDTLSVAEFNRIRFGFPFVIETKFPLVADPSGALDAEQVRAVKERLSKLSQLSLAWPLDNPAEYVVFCGTGQGDLTGWTINFAGKMKKSELDAATVKVLKTPDNAQTPIVLPGNIQNDKKGDVSPNVKEDSKKNPEDGNHA